MNCFIYVSSRVIDTSFIVFVAVTVRDPIQDVYLQESKNLPFSARELKRHYLLHFICKGSLLIYAAVSGTVLPVASTVSMKIAKFFAELYFIHVKSFLSSMEFPKPKRRRVGVLKFFKNWRVALHASVDVLMVSFSAFF